VAKPIACWGWSWAPTTTWPNPSRCWSWWPGCGRCFAARAGADTHELHFGLDQRFRLDTQERRLFDQGKPLPLTQREYELLAFLARHPGRSFGRDELLNRVWGHGFDGFEHTVNSHINRLRNKVEDDPRQPRRIVTVWGVGYRFEAGV
jgi:DNA-binding response OmpR family regulator